MTSALFAAALLPVFAQEEASPLDTPVGTNGAYQSLVLSVRRATTKDPKRAARLAGLLPRRDPVIYWDDRNVPAVSRASFQGARDFALAEWGQMLGGFKPKIVTTPAAAARGLVFSFETRLANGAGATHFADQDAGAPRLETVLGLRRGEFFTGQVDVHNEVLFAVGMYLGLLPNTNFGGAMGRTDLNTSLGTSPRAGEALIAEQTLTQTTAIRKALAQGKPLSPTSAKLWVEAKSFDLGIRVQGQPAEASFAVANNGDGPMFLRVGGDCVCLSATGPTRLEAGESGVVRAHYDTSQVGGSLTHRVLIRTTDPDQPEIGVRMNLAVRTLARFIVPGGPTLLPADGTPVDLYFVTDPSKPVKIKSARVDGMPGELTSEPWRGTLADAALAEGPLPREGIHFRFVPKAVRLGRNLLSLTVQSEDGETYIGNAFLQRGVVATPPAVSYFDLGTTIGRTEVSLSRPGQPFRVLGVAAEGKGVTALLVNGAPVSDLHRLAIVIDPARIALHEKRRVIVRTDDPLAARIEIPVVLPED